MGHSVRSYSDIEGEIPNVRYITLLREPMHRCVSQYLQRVDKYGHIGFERFLTRTWLPNLQTRFIAGTVDLDLAKEALATRFLLVGVIEEFDSFLVLLRRKLGIAKFDMGYTKMRVAKDKSHKAELLHEYRDRLLEIHQADLQLYDYARHVLLNSEKENYGPNFADDLAAQIENCRIWQPKRGRSWLDYVARRGYYEPVTSVIRLLNGLPAKGLR